MLRTRRLCRIALLAAVVSPTVSCSSGRLDSYFRVGRHADVVRAFEADSVQQHRERTLYQAGLSYTAAKPPVYDPARSRALLEELVQSYPGSEYRNVAEPMLVLLRELDRETRKVAAANTIADSLRARTTHVQRELASARARTEELEGALRERDERIQALEEQIAKLKQIDLRH